MNSTETILELIYKFGQRAVQEYANDNVEALTPNRVDNYLSMLAGYSAALEEEMGNLELRELDVWTELRDKTSSDKQADRLWEQTEDGRRQIKLKRTLKGVDKIISACKIRLRRLENEAYNKY